MIKYIIIIILLLIILILYNKKKEGLISGNEAIINALTFYTADMSNFKNVNAEEITTNNITITGNLTTKNISGLNANIRNITSTGNLEANNITGKNMNIQNINSIGNLITNNITGENMNIQNINSTGNLITNNITSEDMNIRNINSTGILRINNINALDISANIVEFKNLKNNSSEINYIWGLTPTGNIYRCPIPCTASTDWQKISNPKNITGSIIPSNSISMGKDYIYITEFNSNTLAPLGAWRCKKPCNIGDASWETIPLSVSLKTISADNYI
jgi:hypothetical protein